MEFKSLNTWGVFLKKSREGVPENINSDKPINIEDIRIDADRVKARRELLEQLGLS